MNAINAYESPVIEHLVYGGNSRITAEGKAVLVYESTGHDDLQIQTITKFHGDVDRISHYSKSFLSMNTPTNLGGCSSRAQHDDLSIFDHRGSGKTDSTLFRSLHLLL